MGIGGLLERQNLENEFIKIASQHEAAEVESWWPLFRTLTCEDAEVRLAALKMASEAEKPSKSTDKMEEESQILKEHKNNIFENQSAKKMELEESQIEISKTDAPVQKTILPKSKRCHSLDLDVVKTNLPKNGIRRALSVGATPTSEP